MEARGSAAPSHVVLRFPGSNTSPRCSDVSPSEQTQPRFSPEPVQLPEPATKSMAKAITSAAVQALQSALAGEVLLSGAGGYDQARAVWNARFDPHPAVMVRCGRVADVVACIEFARQHGLPVSVRGGGHSYAGLSVGDGALALDLSPISSVTVDMERRLATVGPGATWADFDRAAQAHGMATTGATVSGVGVAGYTLGGGTGYLARKLGLGLDNLVAAEVVVADGRVLRVNQEQHGDLFWAIRGGSGNFGVVTSLEFRLHPIGPQVVMAQAFHPMSRARDVLRFYRTLMQQAPDEMTVYAFALRVPPVEPFAEASRGQPALALIGCHCGELEVGEAALQPLIDFGEPLLANVQRLPYASAQQAFDAGMPSGQRWCSRAHYLEGLSDAAIETMVEHVEALPGPFTLAYLEPLGGAIGRIDPAATSFPHRAATHSLHILTGWLDPSEDEEMVSWADGFRDAMAPHATGGVYVNLLGRDEEARVPDAYGANLERLRVLKKRWDPENRFRINHNIRPTE